jgi:hypothetical protein
MQDAQPSRNTRGSMSEVGVSLSSFDNSEADHHKLHLSSTLSL